jgi:hypothetical protein
MLGLTGYVIADGDLRKVATESAGTHAGDQRRPPNKKRMEKT